MDVMQRFLLSVLVGSCLLGVGFAQQDSSSDKGSGANQATPRSDRDKEAEESSSRETRIDISPPKDDAKTHPNSDSAFEEEMEKTPPSKASDVQEFHPWNPMRALKDIEVGDFYFKRKNYRAALARYQDALYYKENDAAATFHVAQCQEKLGQPEAALDNYQGYLKILPHGPFAEEAQKSIERLKAKDTAAKNSTDPKATDQPKQ
jgi:tetratricopeptide (TPR) repeat protein